MGNKLKKLLKVGDYEFELLVNRRIALNVISSNDELSKLIMNSGSKVDKETIKQYQETGEISDEQAQEIVSSSNINPLRMQYLYSVVAPKAFVEMAKNSGNGYTNEQLNSFLVFIRENDLDMQFSNMVMDFLMSGFTQDKENQDKPKIKMTLS